MTQREGETLPAVTDRSSGCSRRRVAPLTRPSVGRLTRQSPLHRDAGATRRPRRSRRRHRTRGGAAGRHSARSARIPRPGAVRSRPAAVGPRAGAKRWSVVRWRVGTRRRGRDRTRRGACTSRRASLRENRSSALPATPWKSPPQSRIRRGTKNWSRPDGQIGRSIPTDQPRGPPGPETAP